MNIGQVVEYATGFVDGGIGTVVHVDELTDTLTVIDLEDGTRWRGSADHAFLMSNDSSNTT